MHCSYPHCTALSLLPFLLTGLSSSFHVPQTAHGSRTTTLNARTPTRELHARSLACLPKKPLSFQAPSYPRSPPQLGQGKANQSCPAALLHRDRNGTSPARARTKRTQASTAKQAGNLAINPTHAAKRGKQGKSLLVPISTPAYALHVCVCVCVHAHTALPLLFAAPTYCTAWLLGGSPNHQELQFHLSGACTCTTSSKRMAALAGARPRTCPRHSIVLCCGAVWCDL